MRAVPVIVEADGRLRISPASVPKGSQLAVVAIEAGDTPHEISFEDIAKIAEAGGAFDFLKDEPNLYTLDDIKPEDRNPDYRGNASGS